MQYNFFWLRVTQYIYWLCYVDIFTWTDERLFVMFKFYSSACNLTRFLVKISDRYKYDWYINTSWCITSSSSSSSYNLTRNALNRIWNYSITIPHGDHYVFEYYINEISCTYSYYPCKVDTNQPRTQASLLVVQFTARVFWKKNKLQSSITQRQHSIMHNYDRSIAIAVSSWAVILWKITLIR